MGLVRAIRNRVRSALGMSTVEADMARRLQSEVDLTSLASLFLRISQEDATNIDTSKLQSVVRQASEEQVRPLFRAVNAGLAEARRLSVQQEAVEDPVGQDASGSSAFGKVVTAPPADAVGEQLDLAARCIRDRVGFTLSVEDSCIEGAGKGVFVNGPVPVGTVVALYPGVAYKSFQVQRIVDNHHRQRGSARLRPGLDQYRELFGPKEAPNVHVVQRTDGVTINAAHGSVSQVANLFAVGHMINHPPEGLRPNVMVCPFDFSKAFVEAEEGAHPGFAALIPNSRFKSATLQSIVGDSMGNDDLYAESLLFVSTRDLHDREELLVNYRFNPDLAEAWPSWYVPVDPQEDARRWGATREVLQQQHERPARTQTRAKLPSSDEAPQ